MRPYGGTRLAASARQLPATAGSTSIWYHRLGLLPAAAIVSAYAPDPGRVVNDRGTSNVTSTTPPRPSSCVAWT
jgi:hypothetical protein